MSDDVQITVHVRDLTGPGFRSVTHNINQLQRQAAQMGGTLRIVGGQLDDVAGSASNAGNAFGGGNGLRAKAIGAGLALGSTLLPTIGALAPMLTGLAVVGGGAALALDDLKKKAKQLKQPFEEWQKIANKAVAPHTEKAVKSLKSAMEDLNPVIKVGADTFGRITEKAARFVASPAFQSSFAKNAEMGSRWVEEFAGSIGTFTQEFLDFGTKSQPALDAWQKLLGGFLDTGLPSMFKELEQGIGGSSHLLSGLASFLNEGFLPALGKVSGSFAEAFGPLLGEMFRSAGVGLMRFATAFEGAMTVVEPIARIAADALHAFTDVMIIGSEVAGSLARNVGGALVDALLTASGIDTSEMAGGFTKLSDWVNENANDLRGVFFDISSGITAMVTIGLSTLPKLYEGFRWLTESVLDVVGGLLTGLTIGFSNLPGMGWLTDVTKEFIEFSDGFRDGLDAAGRGIESFVGEAVPNLNRVQLKLRVDEAEQNLSHIKEQLKDPELTKEREATLSADKTQAEQELAAARRSLSDFDQRRAESTIAADPREFFGAAAQVKGLTFPTKKVGVGANSGSFWSAIRGIQGRVLGTAYINVQQRFLAGPADSSAAPRFQANGGVMDFYASGGMRENHVAQIAPAGSWRVWGEPETGGEAYIPLAASKRPRSRAIAEETVDRLGGQVEWFAKGGMSQTQKDLIKSFGISHFGWMAGTRRDPFEKALGAPADLKSLVQSLNGLRGQIVKIFSGGQEKSLLKHLDKVGKKLIGWEKELGKVEKSLAKAKDKLDSLKDAAASLSSSVKGGILSSANITKGVNGDQPTTVASIMGGLTASRDRSTAFTKALASLKERGLSGALIEQIGEAGIDGGGLETAGALLNASSSEIATMNDLQAQITKAAGSAGKTTADAVYGNAIKLQDKLVDKLEKQQQKLTDAMADLAKALEKTLAKAMAGGKASGGIVGAAASGGIRSNLTWVGEQGPELVNLAPGTRVWSNPDSRRMAGSAWASMLNEPRRGGGARRAAVGAPSGGGEVLVVQLRIGEREFGELWVDTGRKQVRARGGLQATLQPPRSR